MDQNINNANKMLDEDFFAGFNSPKQYKKEQIILEPGMEPTGVYYLKSGFVRLYTISKEGKELTFNIYKPGMYFPLTWALTDLPNIYFLEALTEVELLKAPRNKIVEYIKNNPALLYELTRRAFSGMDGLTKLMDALLSKNAYHQVCSVILMLTRRFGITTGNKQITIEIPLTHRVLGTLAGLSREATSRELEKLTKGRIIDQVDHKIVVKNVKKLEEEFTNHTTDHIIF